MFTWLNNASGTKANISLSVRSGYTVTEPLTFKPMLSLAPLNLSYDDYVPYAKSNQELTGNVESIDTDITNLLTKSLSDCDTVSSNGRLNIYRSSTSTLHSPYSEGIDTGNQSHAILSLVDTNGNWGVQLAIPITYTKGLFMRFKASGTWGAWSKITP